MFRFQSEAVLCQIDSVHTSPGHSSGSLASTVNWGPSRWPCDQVRGFPTLTVRRPLRHAEITSTAGSPVPKGPLSALPTFTSLSCALRLRSLLDAHKVRSAPPPWSVCFDPCSKNGPADWPLARSVLEPSYTTAHTSLII